MILTDHERERAVRYSEFMQRALRETADPAEASLAAELAVIASEVPDDVSLSHNIFNRRAQSILNRAIRAGSRLSADARRKIRDALRLAEPTEMATRIVEVITEYRMEVARLLGGAQLAALLEGAREVARHVPRVRVRLRRQSR